MLKTTSLTEYPWFNAPNADFSGAPGATLEIPVVEGRFGFFYLKLEQ